MKNQKRNIAKTLLKKMKQAGKLGLQNIKYYYKAIDINSVVLVQKQTNWQNTEPRNRPMYL